MRYVLLTIYMLLYRKRHHGELNNLYVIIQKTISWRNSEEDVTIKFCKTKEGQKQLFADFLQNRCS